MDDDAAPDLRHYLAILKRRKGLVIVITILVMLVAVGVSRRQTPLYQASSQMLLETQSVDPVAETRNNAPVAQRKLKNEVRQLTSTQVRDAVAQAYRGPLPVTAVMGSVADTDSDVIRVSATANDPKEVANLVNTYVDTYLRFRPQQEVSELLETGNAVRQKTDELRKRVADLQAPLTALDAKIAAAAPSAAATAGRIPSPQQLVDAARFADLQRERNVKFEELSPQLLQLQSQLAYYQEQLDKVLLSAGIRQSGNLRLLAAATEPTAPISPKPVRNGILGLIIGALLGVGVAFTRDHLDDTLRDKATLESISKPLPTLGVIPRFRTRHGKLEREIVTLTDQTSPAAEAFRGLRTSVKVLGLDGDCQVIQITSANASEGKTLTALNLAVAHAQAGDSTIIVGCDLRRPRLDSLADAHEGPGLTSVLVGDAKLSEAIEHHEEVDLDLLRTGPIPSNPSELLGSKRAETLIRSLRGAYDVVILDCPPLLPVTDSRILAAYSDATLLVVSEGQSSRRDVSRALELLRQVNAPLRGTVLNGSRASEVYGYGRYAYAQSVAPADRSKRQSNETPAEATSEDGILVES